MNADRDPTNFLPLKPAAFHILLSLADSSRHGYGIMLEVQERTKSSVKLCPGTLYGAIKRLLADELIAEEQDLRNWHNLRQAIAEARWPSRRHDWWTLAHGSLHR